MMIGLSADVMMHEWLRSRMVAILPEIWSSLPIVNGGGWEDVFDNSIPSGTNGWLKYGSKKAEDVSCYKITHAFECSYDYDQSDWNVDVLEVSTAAEETKFLETRYLQLSCRHRGFPSFIVKGDALQKIQQVQNPKQMNARTTTPSPLKQRLTIGNGGSVEDQEAGAGGFQLSIDLLRNIDCKENLDICLQSFLDNLSPGEYELREAYEYAMILPESYYGAGSYNKWIRVGFALKNISNRLLVVFLAFSSKSCATGTGTHGFDYRSQIPEICDRWEKFSPTNSIGVGVTKKSIMYWAKNDAFDKYEKVRENTIDYYLDQTIETITLEQINNPKKKNARGSTDYDIATVLFRLCGDEFVATSIRGNEWYRFYNHRWIKNDCGTSLRNRISTGLRDLYQKKAAALYERSTKFDVESEQYKLIIGRAMKVLDIVAFLGTSKDKDNIMKEAREIFYNAEFLDKLDQNKYLMCFNNGVIDFKNQQFRKGYPEDYISKCTETDYVPIDHSCVKQQTLIQEIRTYMAQLFPNPELCAYVWNHLASCLIGDTALNQCLHYYTGCGQNGKSMLVKLMQLILGGYSGELNVGFYTQERAKCGQSTPELFAIIGVRYAITSEPSEGDKLNEGPMKQLTSGTDPMSCRAPYGQLMKFIPQANAIIMANHFLAINSRDHGTWRRVRVIPFVSLFTDNPVQNDPHKPHQFKKVDNLDDKFDQWKSIFMALLVEIAFKTKGICKVCDVVTAASNQYRQTQDFLAEFMDARIVAREGASVKKDELNREFKEWYNLNYGYSKLNKLKELHECMDKRFGAYKMKSGWTGALLTYDRDDGRDDGTIQSGTDEEEEDDDNSSRLFGKL
jgi:P4 family phage/plasmid primase-like protien